MFDRTYYATHPDMMECVSNDELRDRYLIEGLFRIRAMAGENQDYTDMNVLDICQLA